MTRTLIGGCGNDGCLDCTPTFIEIVDDETFSDGVYPIDLNWSFKGGNNA